MGMTWKAWEATQALEVWEDIGPLPAIEHKVGRVVRWGRTASGTADILGAPFCPPVCSPMTADLSHHRAEALSSIYLSYGRRGAERGPDCQHPFPGSHEQ